MTISDGSANSDECPVCLNNISRLSRVRFQCCHFTCYPCLKKHISARYLVSPQAPDVNPQGLKMKPAAMLPCPMCRTDVKIKTLTEKRLAKKCIRRFLDFRHFYERKHP